MGHIEVIIADGDKMEGGFAAAEDSVDAPRGLPGVGNTVVEAVEAPQTLPVRLQGSRSPELGDTALEERVAGGTAVVAGTAAGGHHRNCEAAAVAQHRTGSADVAARQMLAEELASALQGPRFAEHPACLAEGTVRMDQTHQMMAPRLEFWPGAAPDPKLIHYQKVPSYHLQQTRSR